MFGFLKKTVTAEEFGQALAQLVADWLYADADRSLLVLMSEEEVGAWIDDAKRSNASADVRGLYRRFYMHHAIQCACTRFDLRTRNKITGGAMGLFKPTQGYEFSSAFSYLDHLFSNEARVWTGFSKFESPDSLLNWLPAGYQDAAIKSSKLLMNIFSFGAIEKEQITREMFVMHSLTMGSSIATTTRAIDSIFDRVKLK